MAKKKKPESFTMFAPFLTFKALYIGVPSLAAFILATVTVLNYLAPVEAVVQGPAPPWPSEKEVNTRFAQLTQKEYVQQQRTDKALEQIGTTSNWLLRQAEQRDWDTAIGNLRAADLELAKHPNNLLAKVDHNNAVTSLRTLAPLLGYQVPPSAIMLP